MENQNMRSNIKNNLSANYIEMKNNESKNNININQSNENIKMENQNNNCVISNIKNKMSANYIMAKRKSILERSNKKITDYFKPVQRSNALAPLREN